jgi:hypothetical protein
MVMQDSGSDTGIAPSKIQEWRWMLYRHTKRASLGTVAVPDLDPDNLDGWVERPMLNVVMEADRDEVRVARELLGEALPLVRGFLERVGAMSDHPAMETARKIHEFLNG